MSGKRYSGAIGKRKTAVARVRVYEKGTGIFEVNGKPLDKYFFGVLIGNATAPVSLVGKKKEIDITIKVEGGGIAAQSDAVRNGIAKALVEMDANSRLALKKAGFITRDARVKERKKPGLKRARRAPQWKKR